MTENLTLDPVTDVKSGDVVSVDDVISRAIAPQKVEFEYDGLRYMIWIRKSQVPARLSRRIQGISSKILLQCGFKEGDTVSFDDAEALEDPRMQRASELLMENPILESVNAEIAAEATIKQDGKPLTNVPFGDPKKFGKDAILALGALGDAYVSAIKGALNPTSSADNGAEGAPKTKKARATKS